MSKSKNLKSKINGNIIMFLFAILMFACGVEETTFKQKTWNAKSDFTYTNRESMVADLMKNHLKKGMSYQEVISLLGEHENYSQEKSNVISYEIMTEYGWDIDPIGGKTLSLEFTNDSLLMNFYLNEFHH